MSITIDLLSTEDRLGYAAMKSGVFYGHQYTERAYLTERDKWSLIRSQFNTIAKAVIDSYLPDPRVERVARALCDRFDTQDEPVQESLRKQARKAIAAMELGE